MNLYKMVYDKETRQEEMNVEIMEDLSNCCFEKIEDDSDICSNCLEHCSPLKECDCGEFIEIKENQIIKKKG